MQLNISRPNNSVLVEDDWHNVELYHSGGVHHLALC